MIWYRPLREALVEILIKFSLRGPCMILYGSLWEDFADIRAESFVRGPCMILHSSFCEDLAEIRVEPSLAQVFLVKILWGSCWNYLKGPCLAWSCTGPCEKTLWRLYRHTVLHDPVQALVRRPWRNVLSVSLRDLRRSFWEDLLEIRSEILFKFLRKRPCIKTLLMLCMIRNKSSTENLVKVLVGSSLTDA